MSRPTLAVALLSVFVTATAVTSGLALRSWTAAALGGLGLLALFVAMALPVPVARTLVMAARVLAGTVAAFAFSSTLYPILPDRVIAGVASFGGHLLVLLAGVLLLGRVAPAGGGIVIAALGALVAAALPPEPAFLRVAGGVAFAALVAWLLVTDEDRPFATGSTPAPLPSGLFLLIAAAVAGWIAWGLPIAQPKVELAVAEMMAGSEATVGMATESRLGDVERLARSARVALRVYADTPRDLRVRAFTRFDGRTWRADLRPGVRLQDVPLPAARWPLVDGTAGRDLALPSVSVDMGLEASRIVVRGAERGAMPAPAHARAVRLEATGDVRLSPSDVLLPDGAPALYAVLSATGDPGAAAPGPEMLELPAQLDPRVRDLAALLARDAVTADDKVARTVGLFHRDFRYSLEVGAFRTADPVAEFLFEKKKGYCEYFATATTLLLRLQGIPARYVTGYAVRPFQRTGSFFVVRDSDAHAWSEAWVPGRGWIEADATPPGDYEALHGDVPTSLLDPLRAWWDTVVARFRQGGFGALARALAAEAVAHPVITSLLLLAVAAGPAWRRWQRRMRSAGPRRPHGRADDLGPGLRTMLDGVDALCAARGATRPPALAPREHVANPKVALAPDEREACLQAVDLLYAEAYGGTVAATEDVAAATRRLTEMAARPRG